MATFRFDLNEEYGARLERLAADAHMNVQDFIRFKIFSETTIFSVGEAILRIENGDFEDKEFTLPDVYGDDWSMRREDGAGSLGKSFFNYITDHPELGIRFVPGRRIKRRAVYTYNRREGGQNG